MSYSSFRYFLRWPERTGPDHLFQLYFSLFCCYSCRSLSSTYPTSTMENLHRYAMSLLGSSDRRYFDLFYYGSPRGTPRSCPQVSFCFYFYCESLSRTYHGLSSCAARLSSVASGGRVQELFRATASIKRGVKASRFRGRSRSSPYRRCFPRCPGSG